VVTTNVDKTESKIPEAQIAAVLEHRYGDGQIYLPRSSPRTMMVLAQAHGFIDAEGYITRKGRALLARYH
jgi:hypothetical protein